MDTTTTSRPRRSWSIAAAFLALQVLAIRVGAGDLDVATRSRRAVARRGHRPVASASPRPCPIHLGELRRRAHAVAARRYRLPER